MVVGTQKLHKYPPLLETVSEILRLNKTQLIVQVTSPPLVKVLGTRKSGVMYGSTGSLVTLETWLRIHTPQGNT